MKKIKERRSVAGGKMGEEEEEVEKGKWERGVLNGGKRDKERKEGLMMEEERRWIDGEAT